MIYFVSDPHGDLHFGGIREYLDIATNNDLLIILGDVGLNFEKTKQNKEFDKFFLGIDKNIAFVDGNHENFDYIYSFPEEGWNGGTVGRITENIVHLRRGNIYTIEGKSFFVFGGCKSSLKWKELGLWYYGEEPEQHQLDLAYNNLERSGRRVDYILTHKYEKTNNLDDKLGELTDFIDNNVTFKKWYAGHWHIPGKTDEKHIIVYDQLTLLE